MPIDTEEQPSQKPVFKGISSITLFENGDFIVLDKPSGLLSIPDRTQSEPSLKDHLIKKSGQIFTVHRLDKDTSGVIVFAKNEDSHRYLSEQFEKRETQKLYYGLMMGNLAEDAGEVNVGISEHHSKSGLMAAHAKGRPAQTYFKVEERFRSYTWVEFRIATGRTHQIRVHAKHLGHPIVADPLYGDGQPLLLSSFKRKFNLAKSMEEERPLLDRLALHAATLGLKDLAGDELSFSAPLPKDLKAVLQQLRKWNSA